MYAIIELQKNGENMSVLTAVKTTRDLAEQEFHSRASYAAVSSAEVHSVAMLSEFGEKIKNEYYKHEVPAEEG